MADLFNAYRLGSLDLRSRLVFLPVNAGFSRHGRATSRLVTFHRRRAGTGVGLALVGNVAVDPNLATNDGTLTLSASSECARLACVSRAIHQQGTLPGIQLAASLPGLSPGRKWRNSKPTEELARLRRLVQEWSAADIDRVLDAFVASAGMANRIGFRVIEIHAAHGYSLSLLLSPLANERTDRYSVSSGWLSTLVGRLREVVGDAILAFRLSVRSGIDGCDADDDEAMVQLAVQLVANGVGLIDLSSGFYSVDRFLIYPRHGNGALPQAAIAASVVRRAPDATILLVSGVNDTRELDDTLPASVLVGFARPFLADAAFAEKSATGRFNEIVHCSSIGHCHYWSRREEHVACGVNSSLKSGN